MNIELNVFVTYTVSVLAILLPTILVRIYHTAKKRKSAVAALWLILWAVCAAIMVGVIASWPWSAIWHNGWGGWLIVGLIVVAGVNLDLVFG